MSVEILSRSGRPMHTLTDSGLRRYECAWCGQRLDKAKKGQCAALPPPAHRPTWTDVGYKCEWPALLADRGTSTTEGTTE